MHKLLILPFALLFMTPVARSQFKPAVARYLDEINIAEVFTAENKTDSAIRHYELALQYFGDAKAAWLYLGDLYVKKQLYEKAVDAYSHAILNGGFSSTDLQSENYKKDFSDPHLSPFVQRLDSLSGIFYTKKCNWEFTLLIQELHGTDQYIRNMEDVIVGNDTTKLLEFNRLLALTDTAYNLPKLLDYLDTHPFPTASSLNGDVSSGFWIIVHHILQYDNPNVTKLKKYILNGVYNGEFDVKGYVTTLDHHYRSTKNKQLYGMGKRQTREGKYIFFPEIENIKQIDKRRAEWHLLPLYLEKKVNEDWYPDLPAGYDSRTQEK